MNLRRVWAACAGLLVAAGTPGAVGQVTHTMTGGARVNTEVGARERRQLKTPEGRKALERRATPPDDISVRDRTRAPGFDAGSRDEAGAGRDAAAAAPAEAAPSPADPRDRPAAGRPQPGQPAGRQPATGEAAAAPADRGADTAAPPPGGVQEIGGVMMVPARGPLEALGAKVSWQDRGARCAVRLWSTEAVVWLGRSTAQIDGRSVPLSRAPTIEGGRLLVPIDLFDHAWGIEPRGSGSVITFVLGPSRRSGPFGKRPAWPIATVAVR